MTEQELRALVRDAIAKAGVGGARPIGGADLSAGALAKAEAPRYGTPHRIAGHSSHALFTLPPGDPEGRCMIEPGVACSHCGYCKSYGH
jgi:hypothetical protein